MGDLTANFSRSEFTCPCCGQYQMDRAFIETLQFVREQYGQPIKITSGYRCESHNAAIGGVDTSAHRYGLAVDIACDNSAIRGRLLPVLCQHFNRIGIGDGFIHVDVDPDKPKNVIWDYYGSH